MHMPLAVALNGQQPSQINAFFADFDRVSVTEWMEDGPAVKQPLDSVNKLTGTARIPGARARGWLGEEYDFTPRPPPRQGI